MLSLIQMQAEIAAGRSIIFDRRVIWRIEDLPTQEEIDAFHEEAELDDLSPDYFEVSDEDGKIVIKDEILDGGGGGGGGGATNLNALSDVTLENQSDDDVLVRDGSDAQWKNKSLPAFWSLLTALSGFAVSVLGVALSGLGAGSNSPISNGDTLSEALAKLQSQITNIVAGTTGWFPARLNIKHYKASGSARQFTGEISAQNLERVVLTTGDHDFAIGQGICVKGAGTQENVAGKDDPGGFEGSGKWHVAVITDIDDSDPSIITFSPPAARAVEFASDNVQHDDTDAIMAARNALFDLEYGGGVLVAPAGVYRCNKDFSQEQTNGATPVNAIIYPPFFDAEDALHHFEIVGEFRTGTIWHPAKAAHGTIFLTEINGKGDKPSFFAAMGHVNTNPYQTGFNYVECIIRNCHIRCPDNPRIDGVNWKNAVNGTVQNVSVETASHPSVVPEPVNQSTGIHLPGLSNASRCNANDYNIIGFRDAINVGEHSDFSRGNIYRCLYGVVTDGSGYVCHASNLSIEHTKVPIEFRGRGILMIEVDIERAQAGYWWSQQPGEADVVTRNVGLGGTQDPFFAHGCICYVFSFEGGGSAHYTERIKTLGTDSAYLELKNRFLPTQAQYHNPDTTDPVVSLTAPGNNSTVSGGSVVISANASDDRGVTEVEFYADGVSIGLTNSEPFQIEWDTTQEMDGSYALAAVARDQAGNEGVSAVRNVTVDNDGGGVWAPTNLGTLVFWGKDAYTDSGMTNSPSLDGMTLAAIKDESGNGFHLTQSNDSFRPIFKPNQFGNLPGWRFDGGARSISNSLLGAQGANDFTVGCLFRSPQNGISSDGMIIMFGDLASGKRRALWVKSNGTLTFSGYSANLDTNVNICNGLPHYIIVTKNGNLITVNIDGTDVASATLSLSAFTSTGFSLGTNYQGGEPSEGIVRDIIFCSDNISGSDMDNLKAFYAETAQFT